MLQNGCCIAPVHESLAKWTYVYFWTTPLSGPTKLRSSFAETHRLRLVFEIRLNSLNFIVRYWKKPRRYSLSKNEKSFMKKVILVASKQWRFNSLSIFSNFLSLSLIKTILRGASLLSTADRKSSVFSIGSIANFEVGGTGIQRLGLLRSKIWCASLGVLSECSRDSYLNDSKRKSSIVSFKISLLANRDLGTALLIRSQYLADWRHCQPSWTVTKNPWFSYVAV